MKLLPILAAAFILADNAQAALAADPGEAWFTEAAGSGAQKKGSEPFNAYCCLPPVRRMRLA